ncbi:hypothetical protein AB6A40_003429 [Gnathostoma spinigerum]|uniref:Uncharacterized protein n=1 Tax=Gnathostoma spinigerum TaxID=75299 RepID=A0ABD6EAQ9_9BILA
MFDEEFHRGQSWAFRRKHHQESNENIPRNRDIPISEATLAGISSYRPDFPTMAFRRENQSWRRAQFEGGFSGEYQNDYLEQHRGWHTNENSESWRMLSDDRRGSIDMSDRDFVRVGSDCGSAYLSPSSESWRPSDYHELPIEKYCNENSSRKRRYIEEENGGDQNRNMKSSDQWTYSGMSRESEDNRELNEIGRQYWHADSHRRLSNSESSKVERRKYFYDYDEEIHGVTPRDLQSKNMFLNDSGKSKDDGGIRTTRENSQAVDGRNECLPRSPTSKAEEGIDSAPKQKGSKNSKEVNKLGEEEMNALRSMTKRKNSFSGQAMRDSLEASGDISCPDRFGRTCDDRNDQRILELQGALSSSGQSPSYRYESRLNDDYDGGCIIDPKDYIEKLSNPDMSDYQFEDNFDQTCDSKEVTKKPATSSDSFAVSSVQNQETKATKAFFEKKTLLGVAPKTKFYEEHGPDAQEKSARTENDRSMRPALLIHPMERSYKPALNVLNSPGCSNCDDESQCTQGLPQRRPFIREGVSQSNDPSKEIERELARKGLDRKLPPELKSQLSEVVTQVIERVKSNRDSPNVSGELTRPSREPILSARPPVPPTYNIENRRAVLVHPSTPNDTKYKGIADSYPSENCRNGPTGISPSRPGLLRCPPAPPTRDTDHFFFNVSEQWRGSHKPSKPKVRPGLLPPPV